MKLKRIAGTIVQCLCVAILIQCLQCGGKLAGSEVTNEKYLATLYLPDGKPAKSANVLILPADHIPSNTHGVDAYAASAMVRTTTDEQGRYSLQAIADINTQNTSAMYNILADQDSLMVFHDSIQVIPSLSGNLKDTLRNSASLSGVVRIQPNHDVSTVIVQAIGTNIFVNVNSQGQFTIPKLAQGMYRLKISTSLPDYVASYFPVIVSAQGNNTPSSPIILHYSGIPVITGLQASFDTGSGTVRLQWNSTDFTDLADYVVFRDPYDSIQLSTKPIAAVQDTFFVDTVISPYTEAGTWRYKYRVAARNNSYQTGLTYKYVSITAVSVGPFSIYLHFADITDTNFAVNKPVCFIAEISNPRKPIKKILWKERSAVDSLHDSLVKSLEINAETYQIKDSMCLSFNKIPSYLWIKITCSVEDAKGRTIFDTLYYWAWSKNTDTVASIDTVNQEKIQLKGTTPEALVRQNNLPFPDLFHRKFTGDH